MLNDREKVMQLKRNFESYSYYYYAIKEVELKLEELQTRLDGLSSPRIQEVFIENKSYKNNIIELTEKKDRLHKKKVGYQKKIDALFAIVDLIHDKRDKMIIQDYYFNKIKMSDMCKKYNYHEKVISRKVNKILLQIIREYLYQDLEI